MPVLHILAGANGAGKSTIGPSLLPTHIANSHTVFDGDKLALEKRTALWRAGLRVSKELQRIANEHVEDTFAAQVELAIVQNDHFVYEGHFQVLDSLQIFDTSDTYPVLLLHVQCNEVIHFASRNLLPD
jgi:ABC-type branched-subunit amino acid transport system ATPase component